MKYLLKYIFFLYLSFFYTKLTSCTNSSSFCSRLILLCLELFLVSHISLVWYLSEMKASQIRYISRFHILSQIWQLLVNSFSHVRVRFNNASLVRRADQRPWQTIVQMRQYVQTELRAMHLEEISSKFRASDHFAASRTR